MWVALKHDQQPSLLPGIQQALRNLECNQATKRVADQKVRTMGLQSPDRVKEELSHVLDAFERVIHPFDPLCLHPIYWVLSPNVLNDLEKIHDVAAHAMRYKYGRLFRSSFQLHERRKSNRLGLFQSRGQSCYGRRLIDHHGCKLPTKYLRYFSK